jgi:hypothetical protein
MVVGQLTVGILDMKPLKVIAIVAEMVVVCSLAVSSYNAAFGGRDGVHWMAGAPLLTVMALEALRIPTALNLIKSGPVTIFMSLALILGLSVITMEAASIGFENLIFERTRPVVEAEAALEKVMIGQRTINKDAKDREAEISRLSAEADAARAHRKDLGDQKPELQVVQPDKTCWHTVGKGKHARQVSYICNSQSQNDTARANKEAQEAHAAELKTATEQVTDVEKRLAAAEASKPDTHAVTEAREQAECKVADARAMNPMYRVAAAWQKVPVQQLTPEQFEYVKHWAVIALATAVAFSTSMVAVISSMPERGQSNGKLARAIRGWLAARRKTLRRVTGVVRTEFKDRTKVVYVPVDVATGKVLDPAFQPAPPSTPNFKVVG